MTGWKVLTHDCRPPVRGGDPIWDGVTLPHTLPEVRLNVGPQECADGWHYTASAAGALKLSGLWPDGRPSRLLLVQPSDDWIERGDRRRCSQLTIVREATDRELREAVSEMSIPLGGHRARMVREQLAWRLALARPLHDEARVERLLGVALRARGLGGWRLRRYDTAYDAWAAYDTRDAWDAGGAVGAWAAWDARDAWDAWDARDALTVTYAALNGWTPGKPGLLTAGIREAYRHGLGGVIPVAADTLGWWMDTPDKEAL